MSSLFKLLTAEEWLNQEPETEREAALLKVLRQTLEYVDELEVIVEELEEMDE